MARASFVTILALVISGSAGIACTNAPEDFEGGSSGVVPSRKREPNAASGEINGSPETPDEADEEELTGAAAESDPADDDDDTAPSPPPSSDPGAQPPEPEPEPEPEPIPPGSYAIGTELVTTANLNIRDGADTSYPILATAPNGSRVTVVTVSGSGGWVNITWNGSTGWSSKAYLAVP